ncbi:hypothetical protein C8F01DRAFT_1120373 [Mycena amicta]|nr:hypothetical protein C8F01DRAFT_1120373 [Mycena amicta]
MRLLLSLSLIIRLGVHQNRRPLVGPTNVNEDQRPSILLTSASSVIQNFLNQPDRERRKANGSSAHLTLHFLSWFPLIPTCFQ